MSATSGNAATTRSLASAGCAPSTVKRISTRTRRALALSEAMAVTPEEGGPLKGVTLVGGLIAPGVVDLEAQALKLRRHPGHEDGRGPREIAHSVGRLRVVEARPARVAPVEERLEVAIPALATQPVAIDHEPGVVALGEALAIPVPLRPDHEALIDTARARLVTQRDIGAIDVALGLLRYAEPGASELEVERVGEVEVGVRAAQHGQLAEVAAAEEAVVVQVAQALGADRVVEAAGELD